MPVRFHGDDVPVFFHQQVGETVGAAELEDDRLAVILDDRHAVRHHGALKLGADIGSHRRQIKGFPGNLINVPGVKGQSRASHVHDILADRRGLDAEDGFLEKAAAADPIAQPLGVSQASDVIRRADVVANAPVAGFDGNPGDFQGAGEGSGSHITQASPKGPVVIQVLAESEKLVGHAQKPFPMGQVELGSLGQDQPGRVPEHGGGVIGDGGKAVAHGGSPGAHADFLEIRAGASGAVGLGESREGKDDY